jgi:hypothetical protein
VLVEQDADSFAVVAFVHLVEHNRPEIQNMLEHSQTAEVEQQVYFVVSFLAAMNFPHYFHSLASSQN